MRPEQESFIGNDKHLKVLMQASETQDPKIWNKFCDSMGPRFRADLRGANLQGCVLAQVRLVGARLAGVCFDQADLRGSDLSDSDLAGASFREANLEGAKLKVPGRIRVTIKAKPTEQDDSNTRRRRRMATLENSAKALLKDRQVRLEAKNNKDERIKTRNDPSPFTNSDPFSNT